MRAIIYCRVSTQDQVQGGVSMDVQLAKARSWAELNGASEILSFKDEGLSGTKGADQRPGLRDALAAVQRGDALVVYSLSRLSRSTRDCLNLSEILQKKGVDLTSLSERIDTGGASGKMIFRLLSVLSEFERDQISDRTKAALAYKRQNGEKTGGSLPPFGYVSRAGRLYRDEQEQKAIALILDRHGSGESLRSIARELEAAGHRRKGGSASWHPMAVRRIIEREKSRIEHKTESRHLSVDA